MHQPHALFIKSHVFDDPLKHRPDIPVGPGGIRGRVPVFPVYITVLHPHPSKFIIYEKNCELSKLSPELVPELGPISMLDFVIQLNYLKKKITHGGELYGC